MIEYTNGPYDSACFSAHRGGEIGGVSNDHGSSGHFVAGLNTPSHTCTTGGGVEGGDGDDEG